jgi:glycosyltransferase involved in cell wall biosynthesis
VKILHVETGRHLYGGAQQVVYLLSGLRRQGVTSWLVCPKGSAVGHAVAASVAGIFEIPMGGDLDVRFIWRLRRVIKQVAPDLLHLHSRRGADILGGLAGRLCGVKIVHSRRVDNPESRFVVAWKYRLFDRVIGISQGIVDILLEEGVPEEKLVCVRSAVDQAAYRKSCNRDWFLKQFALPTDAMVIATVAQLIPRKGHRYLLQAMPGLIAQFPDLHWLIFGKGALHQELEVQIDEIGLGAHIQLVGFRDDLAAIYPCLDLLVHPALMEGLGVSLLQAASAGLPIVAVDAGGMPEVVEDGVSGRLVPAGNAAALEEAVQQLLANPELRRQMGASGRARMRRDFSLERMVTSNLCVYHNLLENA